MLFGKYGAHLPLNRQSDIFAGEGVEMRGEGGRSVAAELGPQVVGGDEEDVWRRGAGHRRPSGKSQDCQDEAGER